MDNLLELLKSVVGKGVVGKIGGVLGESPEATQRAVDAGIPAIFGGLIKKASTPEGSQELDKQLEDREEGLLDRLDDLLGDAGATDRDEMVRKGPGLLEGIFGRDAGSIFDLISKKSGINVESIVSMLSMLLPIVLSFLKRQRRTSGLDMGGLVNILQGQKKFLGDLMPEGMGDLIGLCNVPGNPASGLVDQGMQAAQTVRDTAEQTIRDAAGVVDDTNDSVSGAPQDAIGPAKRRMGMLPILILVLIALGIWKYFDMRNRENPEPRPMVEEVLPADDQLMPKVELPRETDEQETEEE